MRTWDGGEGRLVRVSRGPGALPSLTHMPGRTQIRILEQGKGWRSESHEALQPVDGPLRMAMYMQSTWLPAPFPLYSHRDRVTLVDEGPDGPTLELQLSDRAVLLARLDPRSHRVNWTQSRLPVQRRVMTLYHAPERFPAGGRGADRPSGGRLGAGSSDSLAGGGGPHGESGRPRPVAGVRRGNGMDWGQRELAPMSR